MIEKAIENILESVKVIDDIYAIAVTAYALQLADHKSKEVLTDRLISMAKTNGNS